MYISYAYYSSPEYFHKDALGSLAATALGAASLRLFFGHRSAEWALLIVKAKGFLKEHFKEETEEKAEEFIGLAETFLEGLKEKYEHLTALAANRN